MIRASVTNVKGITFFPGPLSYWTVTNECLMKPVWLDLSIFPFSFRVEGSLAMAQSLQSRAHRASGHDPLACIKDVACD